MTIVTSLNFFMPVTVTEDNQKIYINNVAARYIIKLLYKTWETSRIEKYMFTHVSYRKITLYKFYAVDFLFALENLHINKYDIGLKKDVEQLIKLLYSNTWLKRLSEKYDDILDLKKLNRLNIPLFPHQLEFLKLYNSSVPKYDLKGYLLGALPGTGKTVMSISLAETLDADVVICIVPKNSVNEVWGETISTRLTTPTKYWLSTSIDKLTTDYKYYVFHYEQVERAYEFFKNYKYKKPIVILDESHNFNEMVSMRTLSFIKLCDVLNTQHVVWSSGTLIKAIGKEVIPMLKTLDKYFTPEVEESFKQLYRGSTGRALEILNNRLGLLTFKVDKSVIVKTEVITTEHLVTIDNSDNYTLVAIRKVMSEFIKQQQQFYEKGMPNYIKRYMYFLGLHENKLKTDVEKKEYLLYREYINKIRTNYIPEMMQAEVIYCNKYELNKIMPSLPPEYRVEFKDIRSIVKYYTLKVQGEALGRILSKLREQCIVDLVPHSNLESFIEKSVKKTVIFTSYVNVVDTTYDYLFKLGYKPLRVYGETNKDLVNIIELFRNTSTANPLIATFKSLSTAVPLIMADTAIMLNSPFRDYEYKQACARLDRIGQDCTVNIINVLLNTGDIPNISTRSNDIMAWSKEQVEAILGVDSDSNMPSLEQMYEFLEPDLLNVPLYLDWK